MEDKPIDLNAEPDNGSVFSCYYLPEEVVGYILSCVRWEDLLSCRLVCHLWKDLIDSFVPSDKTWRDHKDVLITSFDSPFKSLRAHHMPFYLWYAIAKNVFGRNLLKNTFGEAPGHTCQPRSTMMRMRGILGNCPRDCPKFKDWVIKASTGDGWIVEDEPVGSEPLPETLFGRSCFVTSYNLCLKEQTIDLKRCGLNEKIMDEIRPNIEVSEWYARRFDCGVSYIMKVSLLDDVGEVVDIFDVKESGKYIDSDWHQVSHTFKNYNPGVRYVRFQHGGSDTQFWKGHYGSKMAGACVLARVANVQKEETC